VVALSWTQTAVPAFNAPLIAERGIVIAVAALTIVLATAAAIVNDDIEHVVGYSMIADGGVALMGLAVLDPEAWAATRTWLLAVVVTKTAFAAWAAALHATYNTRKVRDLHGWATHSPVLALSLLCIAVAGVGWPGMAAFSARATLLDLAVPTPLAVVLLAAALASLVYYGRLLAIGLLRPTETVLQAAERPVRRQPDPYAARPRPRSAGRRIGVRLPDAGSLWIARRTAIAAAAVLVLAAVSIGVAGGAFGVRAAAEAPPPLLPPEQTAEPAAQPGASVEALPSASGAAASPAAGAASPAAPVGPVAPEQSPSS
jgi:formate hydrogenlyase subunit 3/multisubunit Na+/H+ antiporter MnhD subunit